MARPATLRSRSLRPMSCRPQSPKWCAASNARTTMSERGAYLRDGTAIYERSFAIIRAEADLSRFSAEEAEVAVRMIHACGQVEAARHIVFGGNLVAAARSALAVGAPILCDA